MKRFRQKYSKKKEYPSEKEFAEYSERSICTIKNRVKELVEMMENE